MAGMLCKRPPIAVLSKAGAAIAACCVATASFAMGGEEVRAETIRIGAQYHAAMAHCQRLQGNLKEVCEADAKGQLRVAQAERDAKLLGDADHTYQVRLARADADYRVANERCNDMRGDAVAICQKDAQAAHLKAQQDAQVKRVEAPPAASTDEAMTPLAPVQRERSPLP
jgi:hypothetical protein